MNNTELDTYACLALSAGHLSKQDVDYLDALAGKKEDQMVMRRDTGYFIKLYDELSYNLCPPRGDNRDRSGMSQGLADIIIFAHDMGFRLIEFDADASVVDCFPEHDW